MATPQATGEDLDALERARSRLEVVLGRDENWRALWKAAAEPGEDVDEATRRTRDRRLEMALAGNALYLAWKRIKDMIDGLARDGAGAGRTPVSGSDVRRLLDEIEALLGTGSPAAWPAAERRAAPSTAGSASQPAADRLVDRLDDIADVRGGNGAQPPPKPDVTAQRPVSIDPPEATVTFVVRDARAPATPSVDSSPDPETQRGANLFERLRGLRAAPLHPANRVDAPAAADVEEAEVTIISAEGLRLRREAEERAGFVQRFRKALSGD